MGFEGLDGSFCGIDTVLIRRYKLPFYVLLAKVLGDGMGRFIVQDVEFWFETFGGKVVEDVVECLDDGGGFAVRNGSDNDGIGGIVICHGDVVFDFQGHGWKTSCQIGVCGTIDLVGDGCPAEDVVDGIGFLGREHIVKWRRAG